MPVPLPADAPLARATPAGPPLLLCAAVAALIWPALALPTAFACFIGFLTAPPRAAKGARSGRVLTFSAGALAFVGLVRFVVTWAMPGIVGGGRQAVEQRAVSRLRDVLFAEDAMRRAGWIDPDRDGVGSAAFLEELCGEPPRRGQAERATPVLSCSELVTTPLGPAALAAGYLYTVCLPTRAGGWSALPDSVIEEERAERSFIAYAWPAPGTPFEHAFFIDAYENISSLDLIELFGRTDRAELPEAFGLTCEAAFGPWRERFRPWRGKQPRQSLPGDGTAAAGPAANSSTNQR